MDFPETVRLEIRWQAPSPRQPILIDENLPTLVPMARKSLTKTRSRARSHSRAAINVLVGIMRSNDATAAARVSAANAILDRGWGKATQPNDNGGDGKPVPIDR